MEKLERHVTFCIIRYDMNKLIFLLSLQNEWSALILASKNRHAEVVKCLVDSMAALDLQTKVN